MAERGQGAKLAGQRQAEVFFLLRRVWVKQQLFDGDSLAGQPVSRAKNRAHAACAKRFVQDISVIEKFSQREFSSRNESGDFTLD
jgi:hypothetical protein